MSQDADQYGSYLPPIEPPPPPPPPQQGWPIDPRKPKSRRFAWHEAWIQMLTKPSVQSYQEVLRDPEASPSRAYIWIFVLSTLSAIVSIIAQYINLTPTYNISPLLSLVCVPFVGALAILGLIIGVGIYHIVALILRGKGTFSELVYLYGALVAPVQVISMIASFIPYPFNGCITGPLAIYSLVLTVIVIEAVHDFGWLRSTMTALWWVPLVCLCSCLFIALMSTTDSGTLQNIIDALITPTP